MDWWSTIKKSKSLVFSSSEVDKMALSNIQSMSSHINIVVAVFEGPENGYIHSERMTNSASRRFHALRALKKNLQQVNKYVLHVCNNYILRIMEYNLLLFVGLNTKNERMIKSLVRRCHRIISGNDFQCSDCPMLEDRRKEEGMKAFAKMMDFHISLTFLPDRLSKTQHFFIEHIKTSRRAKAFIPFCSLV